MSKLDRKKIIVDVERIKYPNTGLHNFCTKPIYFLIKRNSFDYYFFTPKRVSLSNILNRINTKKIHKLFLRPSSKFSLWHCTYQDTQYIPKNIKLILTIHDLNFLYTKSSTLKKKKKLSDLQKKINRANYITVISKFVLNDVKKHLYITGKKIKVIYNGFTLSKFENFETPKYLPKNHFLFTIGTVLKKKNFHTLLNLLPQNKKLTLLIAGIQPNKIYLNQIKQMAKDLNVDNRLFFLDSITEEQKYWYYKNCKAFVFPSLAEGFGIPVVEAMSLGKPVFLSTKTSLPEIGGKYAYYFENFEPEHMNEILKNGLEDYEKNKHAQKIINWSKQFSWKESIKQYEEVYKEVLKI